MTASTAVPKTVVSFHAHPDDEALLTGGTLAKAAAAGHRVVLVAATNGGAGLASARVRAAGDLGSRRIEELEKAATAIGAASVELLGYDDSGMDGQAPGNAFARADVDAAAEKLAAILRREEADVLTIYDANGGYGHPDHIQVHHVGVRAAELAGTPAVLEATIDRDLLRRAVRLMRAARLGAHIRLPDLEKSYAPRSALTHRVDVRRHLRAKRAALLAHASQASADDMERTIAFFLRLPPPLFRLVLGSEWFVQRNAVREWPLVNDIFTVVREAPAST
jgi:LmbE family N-acetylglucosaminyl deacetylase